MSDYPTSVQFWGRLTFVDEFSRNHVDSLGDLTGAPWRPGFFYLDDRSMGYHIWPVTRDGDEFGFVVLSPEFWDSVHINRLKPGVEFILGANWEHRFANGVVTRLGSGFSEPDFL